jgi:hypothetical protein
MKMIITQKKVEDLYEEYCSEECYDSWDISGKIINQICPRTTYHSDAEYYFHIHSIWGMVDDYLNQKNQ